MHQSNPKNRKKKEKSLCDCSLDTERWSFIWWNCSRFHIPIKESPLLFSVFAFVHAMLFFWEYVYEFVSSRLLRFQLTIVSILNV